MTMAATKMGGSMGRPQVRKPDKKTVEGQFAIHLSSLMAAKDVSHDDLAERSGLSRATIYNYTTGTRAPSITELAVIAKALGFKSWGELAPPK